jgi:UDP-N-acetylglucosamine 2-epimerase (non-hydrolysing)
MKIISIVGARPQFIKLASLSKELRKYHNEIIVHTGQHYDFELSKIFFTELMIPDLDINLEVGSASHGAQTGEMLRRIEKILIKEKPELVIVFGDTNSTLAGSLAATKLHIKIAHVEAGMRNFDKEKPEEINRIVTDHISDILFAPTKTAINNLKNEGIEKNVHLVGDIMYDGLLEIKYIADKKSKILNKLKLKNKTYILLTIHKQKNTNNRERLEKIVNAITSLNETIVFPAHPRTLKYLKKYNLDDNIKNSNVKIIKPLGYIDFIKLLKNSKKVITDSGGIQKEAYILKIPCITLRETEWIETVKEGWNIVVDINVNKIIECVNNFNPKKDQKKFLGDGHACKKIVEIINKNYIN